MASRKQKNKRHRKPARPGMPHPDGDRQRRGGPSVDQAIRDKRDRREFPGVPLPDSPSTD